MLFGLAPAIQARARTSRWSCRPRLDVGQRRRWGRSLLVGGQVAVSVVLLVLATFMYRGFQEQLGNVRDTARSSAPDRFDPSLVRYTEDQTRRFSLQPAERARSVPGVRSATLVCRCRWPPTG